MDKQFRVLAVRNNGSTEATSISGWHGEGEADRLFHLAKAKPDKYIAAAIFIHNEDASVEMRASWGFEAGKL